MKKITGTNLKPRISVYRSNRFISGQAIDDTKGNTIAAVSTIKLDGKISDNAKKAGQTLGNTLKTKKVESAIFDRNGKKYHGSVAAFADGIRESGIKL